MVGTSATWRSAISEIVASSIPVPCSMPSMPAGNELGDGLLAEDMCGHATAKLMCAGDGGFR